MFDRLTEQPADKILSLMAAFRADPRAEKIDLGVGVYKDMTGLTPVMRAVRAAERRLVEEQTTKAYTSLAGEPAFLDAMISLILGGAVARGQVAAAATPGGTGAIRQGLELVLLASPGAKVWVSDPTWPNHVSIMRHLGIEVETYRYFDEATRGLDLDGMLADLGRVAGGDIVLLHGCCHNPTGVNPAAEDWARIIAVLKERGAVPMVDLAYQGFGDGLDEDATATRLIAASFPEVLIAASCSKNFGIYRERTGILMAVMQDESRRDVVQANLAHLNRQNYSFPPDHGARVVTMVLTDPELRADWEAELEEIRSGMLTLRAQLADELKRLTNSDRFAFVAEHRGMFSRLGASPAQVDRMRETNGIYMVGDSRINIAGLNRDTVPVLARAIIEAGV